MHLDQLRTAHYLIGQSVTNRSVYSSYNLKRKWTSEQIDNGRVSVESCGRDHRQDVYRSDVLLAKVGKFLNKRLGLSLSSFNMGKALNFRSA